MAVVLLAAFSINAQEPAKSTQQEQHRSFGHYKHGRDMMAKKLNFSDAQKQQLKTINSDFRNKMMELKKHDEITVKEYKSQLSSLQKDHKSQLQALLTTEQKDQLAKMKKDRMDKAKTHALARTEKMKTKLGLTDEQASKLKDLRTGTMTKIKSIHADNALSHEQKREQIKGLVMQQKDQLKTILTPEQLQQLEQMKGQHHRKDFSK